MKQGLIFANSCAKAKETGLFSEERLYRMIEAKTFDDALRVLAEVNYGGGINVNKDNFHEALKEEERIASAFVRECAPEKIGLDCFFLRNDYHNLKVLFKKKYANLSDISELILPDGVYTFEQLKSCFEESKLDVLDADMANLAKKIELKHETNQLTSRYIDVETDKTLYGKINSILSSKDTDKYIKQYFVAYVDTTNIETLVRTKIIKADTGFFEENFLEGGSIELKDFLECGFDETKIAKLAERNGYKKLYGEIDGTDLSGYETARDDYLLKIFSDNKTDMLSIAPIVGYYLAKLNEVRVLRLVLICKKNGVSEGLMKKRVRNLYA